MLYVSVDSLRAGDYISDHDKKIANKIAYVLCGGDLSQPTKVSEQYLLELERETLFPSAEKENFRTNAVYVKKR